MTTSRVSVVIPTYNDRDYLIQAVESVADQSYPDIELVVVDDASDEPVELAPAAGAFAEFKILRHATNEGAAAAINTGIRNSSGKLVTVIGADDLMHASNVERKAAALDEDASLGLVFGGCELIDETGRVLGRRGVLRQSRRVPRDLLFKRLLYGNPIVASSVVARRSCYDTVGLYDADLPHGEDWDMWLRMSRHYDAGCVEGALVSHRIRGDSLQKRNFASNADIESMRRLLRTAVEGSSSDYEEVMWRNYFRMLRNKPAVSRARDVLGLYVRGLRESRSRPVMEDLGLLLALVSRVGPARYALSSLRKRARASAKPTQEVVD